jgi:hypothetical protein
LGRRRAAGGTIEHGSTLRAAGTPPITTLQDLNDHIVTVSTVLLFALLFWLAVYLVSALL